MSTNPKDPTPQQPNKFRRLVVFTSLAAPPKVKAA
jgi:hypothetical protein